MLESGRPQADCPVCDMPLNAHTNTCSPAPPQPGDLTVCLYCRSLLVFTLFGLRRPTDREEQAALRDPNVRRAVEIVADLHRDDRVEG